MITSRMNRLAFGRTLLHNGLRKLSFKEIGNATDRRCFSSLMNKNRVDFNSSHFVPPLLFSKAYSMRYISDNGKIDKSGSDLTDSLKVVVDPPISFDNEEKETIVIVAEKIARFFDYLEMPNYCSIFVLAVPNIIIHVFNLFLMDKKTSLQETTENFKMLKENKDLAKTNKQEYDRIYDSSSSSLLYTAAMMVIRVATFLFTIGVLRSLPYEYCFINRDTNKNENQILSPPSNPPKETIFKFTNWKHQDCLKLTNLCYGLIIFICCVTSVPGAMKLMAVPISLISVGFTWNFPMGTLFFLSTTFLFNRSITFILRIPKIRKLLNMKPLPKNEELEKMNKSLKKDLESQNVIKNNMDSMFHIRNRYKKAKKAAF